MTSNPTRWPKAERQTAPYNPETLNWIRNGATPQSLGWDEQFYRKVCRDHGIEPVVPAPKIAPEAQP